MLVFAIPDSWIPALPAGMTGAGSGRLHHL